MSDVLQASDGILKQKLQSFKARLRMCMTPCVAVLLMSHSPYPYTQQQTPIYLFLHHHGGKLLCKWHSSLSLFCKYNVIGDVNNPFVCLTRSSRTPPVSLIQLLRFREWREWRPDLKAAVLMTFKLITATCCCGVAHLKPRVMKRGALHNGERN